MKRCLPVPVDNGIYDRMSDAWWDGNSPLGLLRTKLGPVRFGYFRSILNRRRGANWRALQVLDVGCGGGLLAEDFAGLGCRVSGIDPSQLSLRTARSHARLSNLPISYQRATGAHLPFRNSSFDVVLCCDVLEHVSDVAAVVLEISRVLAPGGIFFYDTINATFLSWLAVIRVAQEWRITRFMPAKLHDAEQFVKPRRLQRWMREYCLENQETRGISFRGNPIVILGRLIQYKHGKIGLAKLADALHFRESRNTSVLYMGYALKRGD